MDEVKKHLIKKQHEIHQQIQRIEFDDPIANLTVAESLEVGAEAWEAEIHAKVLALKDNLHHFSGQIQKSLHQIQLGTYGQCEKCHQQIGKERLKALPSATLCLRCVIPSKKF